MSPGGSTDASAHQYSGWAVWGVYRGAAAVVGARSVAATTSLSHFLRICRPPQQWCEYFNRQLSGQVVVLTWHLTVPEVQLISLKPGNRQVPRQGVLATLLSDEQAGPELAGPDGGFRRRFRGRDAGLGAREVGLRRAAWRGAAGTDHGSRRGALVGWLASLDALCSVGLVGEWRPAGARALCGCCEKLGGWAGQCMRTSSRQGFRNVGERVLTGCVERRCLCASCAVSAGVFVCSVACCCRRFCVLNAC